MKKTLVAPALIAVAAVLSGCSGDAGTGAKPGASSGPVSGPGWTGATRPDEMIFARLELMEHMEELMKPIDTLQVQEGGDPAVLRLNAEVIGAMLLAVPHLFPPTTDLYDPAAEIPRTIALPAIWKDFDNFYRLAAAASKAAENMANAEGRDAQRVASAQLRGSCDACHVLFLRKYEPPKIQPSDADFDFESALPGK